MCNGQSNGQGQLMMSKAHLNCLVVQRQGPRKIPVKSNGYFLIDFYMSLITWNFEMN